MDWDEIDTKFEEFKSFPVEQRSLIDKELKIDALEIENLLESNSLTRSEISVLLKSGLSIGGKDFIDHLETVNHSDAYDWVQSQTYRSLEDIDLRDILYIHLLISKGIEIQAGRIRMEDLQPTTFPKLPTPDKILQLLQNLIAWIQISKDLHPIDLAIEAHYRLLLISPFQNRNGRVARMFMNMILIINEYPISLIIEKNFDQYSENIVNVQNDANLNSVNKRTIGSAIEYSLDMRLNVLRNLNVPVQETNFGGFLKIGELAKSVGEANSTIRYWMKKELLKPAKVLPSGYQLFNQESLARAHYIQDLKSQRYTLSEIKGLIIN